MDSPLSSVPGNSKYKKVSFFGLVLTLLVGFFLIYHSVVYRTEISSFTLTASIADATGIAPGSHFLLKTTAPLTSQVIEKYIKVSPSVDFSVVKVSSEENTFEIIPEEELKSDQVYTIAFAKGPLADRDFSWAYQVKAPFQITSSIPRDKGTDVPTDTGIEIYFNRGPVLDPEKFIEITPAVSGKFEVAENRVRFIPKNPLALKTVYTVKIKSGLRAQDTEDIWGNEQRIQFQTRRAYSSENTPSVYFSRQFSEFKPDSSIVFGIGINNASSVDTTVYQFDSAQKFLDSVEKSKGDTPWSSYYSNVTTTLGQERKVFSGTLPVEKNQSYYSNLRLPQTLPVGYYAIAIKAGESEDISWFQVNPTASFVAFASGKSLVWLKDIASEKNSEGVSVIFNNKKIGQTGADGVALFNTPEELIRKPDASYYEKEERKFLIAETASGALVIPVESEYGSTASLQKKDTWWKYVSLNKNIYLPTDTVRFWAIGKLREGDVSGEEVTVKLTDAYWSYISTGVTYAETKLKISEFNAITGELSFAKLKPGVYDLTFLKGDEVVAKQSVTVGAYIKPAYKMSIESDKTAIFAGDSVTFKVKAEFFDGTPVANMALSYSAYGDYTEGKSKLTLDSRGEGSFVVPTKYKEDSSYWPSMMSVNVQPEKAEEGNIEVNTTVFVFGPYINNLITQTQSAKDIVFEVKTREVVINDLHRTKPYWDNSEYLGGPVAGVKTQVAVSEILYFKNETGTGYDPINKLTYPVYEYRTEERAISSQTINSNQEGLAQFAFVPEKQKTYKFIFTSHDYLGRKIEETRYAYGDFYDRESSLQDSSYYLKNLDEYKDYKIGDSINLQLQTYEGVVLPPRSNSFIFMKVNNGVIEYEISDSPKYNTKFREKDIPNIGIWPGWFRDGRFHNSYLENISFDANERRLNIEITKDKASYKPGETVGLSIKVTNKNNVGVKAEVNLSALDEAVFSVRPYERDIISDLYQDIYSQLIIRTSNVPPYGGGGAEKGGGEGDGAVRSNIQEIAIFKSVTTDANGSARVEFKLPDNITSWRLTTQAVTKDLLAGKDTHFIGVTLPLFVDATLNSTYLAGDELLLRLRTFGTSANQGSVNYFAESQSLPFGRIEKSGGSSIEVPLGMLTLGNHDITVGAESGGLKDALTRQLRVLKSYFTKNSSDFYEGKSGLKIKNNAIGNTTLTFRSYGRGRLYNNLKSLSYEDGIRLDQKGAGFIAKQLLNTYFGEKNELPEFESTKYQSSGLQLLPYSSEELELSAISAHLFEDDVFKASSLRNYFSEALRDTKSDISRISRALYGLSAFDEPVLSKIQSIKNDKSLGLKDKVFIALALDSIGAKEETRVYYKEMIKPFLVDNFAYAYLSGLKGDDTIITTALVSALTASLEEPESIKLSLYLDENVPKETLVNFERLLYIKSALPKLDPEDISFSYHALSREGTETLENGESFELTLTSAELASFELKDVKGKLGVSASYEQESTPQSILKDKNISLARSYEVNGSITKELKDGDKVLVRLYPYFAWGAVNGAYQIIDYLPSGLRAIEQDSERYYSQYDGRVYPTEVNDQKVTFVFDKSTKAPVYYYARVVSKGTYKAEPAFMQSLRSLQNATVSNEDSITIR